MASRSVAARSTQISYADKSGLKVSKARQEMSRGEPDDVLGGRTCLERH